MVKAVTHLDFIYLTSSGTMTKTLFLKKTLLHDVLPYIPPALLLLSSAADGLRVCIRGCIPPGDHAFLALCSQEHLNPHFSLARVLRLLTHACTHMCPWPCFGGPPSPC